MLRLRYSDEQVAEVCHEANRALQAVQSETMPSQPWVVESEHVRRSAVEGVRLARQGATPREQHESWVRFKRAEGWIYGPEKDPLARRHPNLRPYDELPEDERDKDVLFLAVVTALTIRLPADEADSLAANCGQCWARPGELCSTQDGRPHPARITRARRRGALGGVGRAVLEQMGLTWPGKASS